MIHEFRFKNFKSYKDASLQLSSLTLLIGANASGKSNSLEGIRLLSWLSQGKNLSEIIHEVEGADTLVRGSISDLTHNNEIEFSLTCTRVSEGKSDWPSLEISIKPTEEDVFINEEKITSPNETLPLYHLKKNKNQIGNLAKVSYNNFKRGNRKPQLQCINQKAVFTQLVSPASFSPMYKESQKLIPLITQRFRDNLGKVRFLEPVPSKMRTYNNIRDQQLKEDGSNISSTLLHLIEPSMKRIIKDKKVQIIRRKSYKEEILNFIRSLPEQDVKDIKFIRTERNDVMLQLIESFGKSTTQKRDAAVLSDGTLRILAIAAALYSAPEGALVIIEEIDNGVHPSRACLLIENIKKVADERNFNVLLTSHNPALLDALPIESIPNIVCCYRDPEEGDSKLIKLDDVKAYPELVALGPIGQLMTKGILDRFVKDNTSDEEKKKHDLDWFDSLLEDDY